MKTSISREQFNEEHNIGKRVKLIILKCLRTLNGKLNFTINSSSSNNKTNIGRQKENFYFTIHNSQLKYWISKYRKTMGL